MHDRFRRRMLCLGLMPLIVYGCSSTTELRRLELQRADEAIQANRAGRFSVQVLETPPVEPQRGSQGSFEWLEYRSAQASRSLLLIIGPFGQFLGGIEQRQEYASGQTQLRLFDEQGQILQLDEQWRLISSVAGKPLEASPEHAFALEQLMQFLSMSAKSQQRIHETTVQVPGVALQFRLVFDTQ